MIMTRVKKGPLSILNIIHIKADLKTVVKTTVVKQRVPTTVLRLGLSAAVLNYVLKSNVGNGLGMLPRHGVNPGTVEHTVTR